MGLLFSRDENTNLYALESKMAKKYTHTDSSMKFMAKQTCESQTAEKSLERINEETESNKQQSFDGT
jgi:hypothetical protein